MEKPNGCVKFFNDQKGFGFITVTEGEDKDKEIFCHFSSIESDGYDRQERKALYEGQTVYMEYDMAERGLKTSKVKLVPANQPGGGGGGGGYGRQGGGYQDYNRGYGDRGGYQDRGYGSGGGGGYHQQRY